MKTLYYGFWNILLVLPEAVRILLGVMLIALCVYIMWPVEKYIVAVLIKVCMGLHYLLMGGARYILPRLFRSKRYIWDEKIAGCGKRNSICLQDKYLSVIQSRRQALLHSRAVGAVLICCYLWAIIPFFHLDKYLPPKHISQIYCFNQFLTETEDKLTKEIDNYPPFWIAEETGGEEQDDGEIMEEETREPVYLKLNEATSYANIRETADIGSDSLFIVSKEDELLYNYIYEHDSERFWLKVTLPEHNLEGWISANVIEQEILHMLDLQ